MGNRDALLEAALVCLRERGYGTTTARDLAGTAGVSLGAIRYHFGSTEGLLNEAIAESGRRWISRFRETLTARAGADPTLGLVAAADDLYTEFAANHELLVGYFESLARALRSETVREQFAGYYDEFRAELCAAFDAALGNTGEDTAALASLLIAVVDGLMVQWLLDPDRALDPAVLRAAIVGVVSAFGTGA